MGINGSSVCLFDAEMPTRAGSFSSIRRQLGSERGVTVLCGLLGAQGLAPAFNGAPLERVMTCSERHRAMVRLSLRTGVSRAVVQMVSAFRGVSAATGSPAPTPGCSMNR